MHDDLTVGAAPPAGVRTVIITGGTKGIGLDIVTAFHANDNRVFALARNRPDDGTLPLGVEFVSCDVTDLAAQQQAVASICAETGRLDVFVNNAGRSAWRPIEHIDEDFLEEMLSVNLKSAFWGSRAAAAHLRTGGAILNISSLAGKRGGANNAAYVAAKFGMNGLTQSLAKELGPRGIRVNALCPVLVETPGLRSALEAEDSPAAGSPDAFLTRFSAEQSALRRLPLGREVADVAVTICSDASSAITGQCINVDCGVFPQ